MELDTVLVAVASVESLAEILFGIYDQKAKTWNIKLLVTMLVGLSVALVIPGFDLYAAAGITVVPPIAGRILTGLLASRGAKLFHDFLSIVETFKSNLKRGSGNSVSTPASSGGK